MEGFGILLGYVLRHSGQEVSRSYLLASCGNNHGTALLTASVYFRRYLGGILTMSERKRKRLEQEDELPELVGRKPVKLSTCLGMTLLCCMIIIAWVLFIKYSL